MVSRPSTSHTLRSAPEPRLAHLADEARIAQRSGSPFERAGLVARQHRKLTREGWEISVSDGGRFRNRTQGSRDNADADTLDIESRPACAGVCVGGTFANLLPRCGGEQNGGFVHSSHLGRDPARCYEFPTGSGCGTRGVSFTLSRGPAGPDHCPAPAPDFTWSRASRTDRFANAQDPHPPCPTISS